MKRLFKLDAEEARKISKQNSYEEKIKEKIEKSIIQAAKEGKYYLLYRWKSGESEPDNIFESFREKGFVVEKAYGERGGICEELGWNISWR